jgi:hypothetical protein
MTTVAPGWYPDPAAPESGALRWWSGEAWTTHVQAPPMLPPMPEPQLNPVEPAYVPFSSANTYQYAEAEAPAKKRPISVAFAAVALIVGAGLAAGAVFGIPALFGPTGAMALTAGTPYVAPTPVPFGADLGDTTTPLSTAAIPTKVPADTTASSALKVEVASAAKLVAIARPCAALWYTSPVTDADSTSIDPVQSLPIYGSKDLLITSIARQFSTVEAAEAQQANLLTLMKNCQRPNLNALGSISTSPSTLLLNYAPAAAIGWTSVVHGSKETLTFQSVQERVANRTVRVVCIENGAQPTAAVTSACAHNLASVAQVLTAAKPG